MGIRLECGFANDVGRSECLVVTFTMGIQSVTPDLFDLGLQVLNQTQTSHRSTPSARVVVTVLTAWLLV